MLTTSHDNGACSLAEAGFTLLEVLIALVLLVVLSGALYGTFFSILRSRDYIASRLETLRDARATLDMLRREIAGAYYDKDNKRLHFVVEDRDSFGKQSSTLDFTTAAMPLQGSAPAADMIAVRYQIKEKDRKLLVTRQEKNIYLDPEQHPYPQVEELEGFLVECYNGNTWVKSWDTALNNALPQAVRVTISIREGDKSTDFFMIAKPRMGNT